MSDEPVPRRNRELPLLAVPYFARGLTPWAIAQAAAGCCELLWLVDALDEVEPSERRILKRLGTIVDLTGVPLDAWSGEVARFEPDAAIAFADHQMVALADCAAALGLRFHSPEAARCLTDKYRQRAAFAAHGIAVPRSFDVPPEAGRELVEAIVGQASFPVVLKPRYGADSRLTYRVERAEELRALLTGPGEATEGRAMVVEEYLSDTAPALGEGFANYLSVESIVDDGVVEHFTLTGRFPPAEPFRETGFFMPATPRGALRDELAELASVAARALGITSGCLHTEIKITAEGPRVIEVNGRLGGGIPAMVEQASGAQAIRLAIRNAVGEHVAIEEFGTFEAVGFRFMYQAPARARRIVSIEGLDKLRDTPGVASLNIRREAGSVVDWRLGNGGYIFGIIGAVPDYEGVRQIQQTMFDTVAIEYEWEDG